MSRRNPHTLQDTSNILNVVALLGIGYLVIQVLPLLKGLGSGVTQARNVFATGLAKMWVGKSTETLTGSVILSTGQEIPIDQVKGTIQATGKMMPDGITPEVRFMFQNQPWVFTGPSDETGTYYAVPVP